MTQGPVRAKQFARNTIGLTALAAVLSLTAVPVAATAQDRNGGWRGGQQSQQSNQNRGEAYRNRGAQNRSESSRSQPSRTQAAPQQSRQQTTPTATPQGRGLVRTDQGRTSAAREGSYVQRSTANRSSNDRRDNTWRNNDQRRDNDWRGNNDRRDGDWNRNRDGRDDTVRYRNGTTRQWSNNKERRWDRDWRHNNRYDWRNYRNNHRNTYRIGRYYAPYAHYSYRRVGIGFRLGNLFYSNRYWIDDPWQYRLPDVYGPYRWVRYYDDVLLVNIYTGEVVDVIEDFFW